MDKHDFELPRGVDERLIPLPACAVCGEGRWKAVHNG